MKLALCLEYPIGLQGGVSVLVGVFLKELSALGHEIVLVSPDSRQSLLESEAGRLATTHLSWDPEAVSRRAATDLAHRLAQAEVHLAHFHMGGNFGWGNRFLGYCPIPYLQRLGVPCISSVHLVVDIFNGYCGPQKPKWFKLGMLPLAWLAKADQLRHVRTEIAVSQHDLEKLQRWYRPFRRRFVQIYHSRLHSSATASGPGNRGQVILNVGHIAWRKGQATLAEAFARIAEAHPAWTLQLVGPDSGDGTTTRIRAIAQANKLENRILLLGSREDAQEFMRRAQIYVQPSTAEALGLALQEAMFHGCACIGTNAGGIPELIRDGQTGRLVEAGNTAQLANALNELISNGGQRERWSQSGADFIRQNGMTVETMIQKHTELYERLRKR